MRPAAFCSGSAGKWQHRGPATFGSQVKQGQGSLRGKRVANVAVCPLGRGGDPVFDLYEVVGIEEIAGSEQGYCCNFAQARTGLKVATLPSRNGRKQAPTARQVADLFPAPSTSVANHSDRGSNVQGRDVAQKWHGLSW